MSAYTRFGIGGPADLLIDASTEAAFESAYHSVLKSGQPLMVWSETKLGTANPQIASTVARISVAWIRENCSMKGLSV